MKFPRFSPAPLRALLLSPGARPLRFVGTGGTAGACQLALLLLLTHAGWNSLRANIVAFLAAAQLNFILSCTFTWRDRWHGGTLLQRWVLFHGSIATMAGVNMLAFVLARPLMPAVLASMIGIAAGAVGNYGAGDSIVFRRRASAVPVPIPTDLPLGRYTSRRYLS